MSTLGRNIAFPIYKGNGSSFHNLVIRKSTSDSVVMSLGDKVTGDVYYKDNTLVCDMDEYIMVDGVKYSIVNPPTIVREGLKSDNGDLKGMTKYSFEFYHPMYMLGNMAFSDVAVTNAESMFKSHDRTFSWIGNLTDFVAKLNKNLQDSQFIVSISSSIDADSRNVLSDVLNFTNNTIADALKTAYDTWHFPFVVDVIKSGEQYYSQGKRFLIQFGNPTREILDANNQPFVFHFGKGVGLKNNSRTPRNNKIVTRVAGYGSEQNIPYGYPQIPWTGDPSATTTADGYPIYEGIVGGVVTKLVKHPFTRTHLMPSVYSESVRKKVNSAASDYDNTTPLVDYYDAPSSYPNPINLDAPRLDIVGIETIKPELGDMAILGATPVNDDLTPASGWDDTMDDDGNYLQSYFKITLPQLDFDIYACASITEEMKINMRSGACIGCTFDAQVDWDDYKKNFFDAQGNFLPNGEQRDLSKYPKSNNGSIDLIVKKDLNTYGMLMPNVYQQPAQGDKFVILGISMPSTYITNAEERLDAALMTHMLDNNVYYYDYPLKFDEDFFYNNTDILSQVRPNSVLRFTFGGEEKSLYIKQITIKYGEGVLPKYDITLTDNIEVVLNQIGLVADDVSRLALAMMQMNKRTNINISNTESLQKYVDYTIMPNLESIQRQIDGSQVTYFGNEDPFDSAHPYSDGKYIVDPTKFPASEWDDDYSEHDGDMFYNRETGKGYEFTIIDNSSSPVVYGWQLIQDEDIIQALNNAQTAQDTADGKRRVFICDASHHTPNPPYDVGDLWVNVKYPYSTGATYDDEILKCVVAKTEGQSFSINDWSLANGYTAALRNFINGTYANNLQEIQTQIDGKAETWYQNTDPSTAWTTTALKNQHKGDIWHNSSNATINGVKAGQDAIWNGTAWVVDETVPAAIYDEIDGKCAIYVSWGAWGNDLQEKDLFIPADDVTIDGVVTYKANKVYRCVDKDTPLFQEIAYTDDTQYNGFITKLIGSSGQTKDAAENAIAAIKHALNEGNTYNEGGLILSNLISLGTGNPTSGTFTPWAGISGIYKTSETGTGYKGHGIAAWFGGGMVDKEVSQSATNAAKSLFRFDGSGYVANGNITWDENGQVTIQGYQIQVGGSNVATESSISTFFANFFDIYNGSTQITYAQYVALQDKSNVSIKAKYGLWTEQFLSALGLNSQGGGGTGDVSAIRVSSTTLLQPTDGVIDMTNYVSTATQRSHWDAVYAKVPAATYNTGNELADKNFVNSSISTATAEYQGSKNLVSDLSLTTSATRTQIGTALGTAISGADNNDYCFVEIPTSDSDPTQIARVERYKYNGTSWSYEYTLNNSGFTSNQWSAINSGITSTHVTKLNGIAAGAQVNVLESVKINGTALTISSKAVNIATGNGLQSSTNTISIKLDTNSGLSVSSSGLKLDVVNTLDSTLTYKALSAAQGKSLNDRLAILESWFEVDADGNVKTKDKPNNGGHRGFYTESFVSALGSNSSGGGAGGGTVTGIIIGSGNPILPDSNGSVTIPAYPTSLAWSAITGKPTTLSGYGITDALSSSTNYAASSSVGGAATSAAKLTNTTKIGDTNQPVYFTANGVPVAISYTIGKSVPTNAVFTDTTYKLTLNGTTNGASGGTSLGSFYAPTAVGTDGYVLKSSGSGAPSWVAQSTLSVGTAAKLNTGTTTYTAWGQTYWQNGLPKSISNTYMSGVTNIDSLLYFDTTNSRVGIGTSSPSYKLDVNGEVRGTAFRTTTVNGSYGTLNSRGSISCYLDNYSSGFATGMYVVNSGGDTLGSAAGIFGSANAITRYYYGGSYDAPLMSILPSGNVGIGTTSPSYKLHVNGYTYTTRLYLSSSVYLEYDSSNSGVHLVGAGFYSDSYVSALGSNSSGGGAGVDLTAVWASLTNTENPTYSTTLKINANHIPNLNANKITEGTLAAARIPVATASAVGGIKVGTTLAISDGVLNQKSGIATAGTYRSVTVDTYGRITAGTNPTTLSGYGITNAYTKTQVDNALSGYLPLSGGTLTGTLTVPKIRINTRHNSGNTSGGIYYYDGTTDYLLIGQGSANLWIGANETSGTHHTGGTYISAGDNRNLYVSKLVNNTRTNYTILDTDNTYTSSGKGYIYGTEITTISGNAATATKATQDGSGNTITSTYLTAIGRSGDYITQTKGGTTSNVTKILERNGTYTHAIGATGWYRIGRFLNTASQSASCILLLSRSYAYKGNESYAFSITLSYSGKISISQLAGYYHSTQLIDKIRVEYVTDNSTFYPPIDIHVNADTTGNNSYRVTFIGGAQALSELEKDPTLTGSTFEYNVSIGMGTATRSTDTTSVIATNSNGSIGIRTATNRGLVDATTDTWLVGTNGTNTWLSQGNVGIGTTSPAYKLDVSGDIRASGKVYVGTGGADSNSYIYSDTANNIYLRNSSGAILVCDGKVIRRSTSLSDVTLGSSSYRWGGVYSTIGDYSGNLTTSAIYTANGVYHYWKDSGGTDISMISISSSNNAWLGYGLCPQGYQLRIGGGSIQFYYGTSRTAGMLFNTSGYLGVGNTNPSQRLHVTGNILASGEITASSDERKKNIISNTKFSVKDIASARSIIYEWNDDRDKDNDKKIHGGSIAQDWLGKADSFLSQDNDGWYSINYGALALCSAITIARMTINHEDRITILEKENAKLKARVAELEERRAL